MPQRYSFLVVGEDPERLLHISTTLHGKFPNSIVQTCCDSEATVQATRLHKLDAIVTHRSSDMDEIPLIERLRAATGVPLLALLANHQEQRATAAGASRCLQPEQWLLVGTVVEDLIGHRAD